MKKLIYTSALLAATFQLFAQKIDLDNSPIQVKYIRTPNNYSLADYKSYSAFVYAKPETIQQIGLNTDNFSNSMSLNGYQYQAENGDIVLETEIKGFTIVSDNVETKQYTEKDGSGNVVTKTGYVVKTIITAPTFTKAYNTNGTVVFDKAFYTQAEPYLYESSIFPDGDKANAFKKDKFDARLGEFKNAYKNTLLNVWNGFKQDYDFVYESKLMPLWHFDINKNPEFEEFNKKLEEATIILKQAQGYEDIAEMRAKLQPFITYCKENNANTNGDDKRIRKIKYAYLINVMRIQTYLEQPDESDLTAKDLIANDYDKLDGKVHISVNKLLRESLQKLPNNTTHVKRESFFNNTKFSPTVFEPKVVLFKFPKPPVGFQAFPGYIITYTKDKITGQLWAKKLGYDILDPEKSGAKFVYEENGVLKQYDMDPKLVDEISLGRDILITRIKFKNTMGAGEGELFFRKYYENDKIVLLNYYYTKFDSPIINNTKVGIKMIFKGDLCIMDKATGIIEPVSGLTLNAKATEFTAEYYKNCTELADRITKGEFGNLTEMDNQVKVADAYLKTCK